MAFENIERRFQRWKVIMVPGAKSYESWDEMVTGENFSEETRMKTYKKHRTKAIDRTLANQEYIHTMTEDGITVRYRLERWR
ncbi:MULTISPECIES: hypothetical protein [Enterobacteriaceae]|jgi:hypothetical protein|uniref:hypothetical protein n=1 Tax=Enterobacteriaceae TaxID=543 RepID=UPI001D0ACA32|nr:hypothetical protein [Escherichia coli]MBY6249447.1 hypothetical protein [Citrobacter werkmanii]HCE8854479.1 hypothetical protein [Citrobacter freundii]MDY8053875.1 hypothetical protein [Escherichia coli]UVF01887.1 hypothetical protein KW498_25810 [Escherichia coli]HBN4749881.1 hypothetical protein [Escherichia coli]